MSFGTDGTILKITLETIIVINHAFRGNYMSITQVLVTVGFKNMSQQHLLTKLILQIC